MHQYMWNTRTELIINGETKDTRIDQERSRPTAKVQKTELNNESSGHPKGFLPQAHR